jgi:Rps23 Pro-64 3,4-dihydroxylase Tpa1-like proline 4-hydroxylase
MNTDLGLRVVGSVTKPFGSRFVDSGRPSIVSRPPTVRCSFRWFHLFHRPYETGLIRPFTSKLRPSASAWLAERASDSALLHRLTWGRWKEVWGSRTCQVSRSEMSPFFFDPDVLLPIAEANRDAFTNAKPFKHVVLDDFFPDVVLDQVLDEFPKPSDASWFRFSHAKSHKLGLHEEWLFGANTRQLLNQLNGAVFVQFIEALTGIEGLIPDPHFQGGGLHQIEPGGFLKVHTDFNFHSVWKLDRRINVLVYLNKNWNDAWGGQLELWDESMSNFQSISPVFNRMVVFATTDSSKHGHPDPLACPEGVSRRSLALYYYSNGRPISEESESHLTTHFERPGEAFEADRSNDSPLKTLARDFLPPAAIRGAAKLQSRMKARGNGSK